MNYKKNNKGKAARRNRVMKIAASASLLVFSIALFRYGYRVMSFISFVAAIGMALSALPFQYMYLPATVSIALSVFSQVLEAFSVTGKKAN